ncbi:MAG: adenylate/guanylate cyclase domain-containing protein [Acidimicrobiia bacterium]
MTDRQQLETAIAAQEGLRGVVPDEIVDAAVATLRHRLQESRSETQRRRQVTVLFADVSGFTSMSSRLDAEVVAGVMNELWSRLDAIITDHGGRIDKHIGDAIMAVWGAATTTEDDPERAVRAGLAMQEELEQRSSGDRLAMRIGINTGPAHLGAVGASAEFTAMGDTVNVASRVQGLAPLGGVLVTHDTYRHIRGIFDVEALDPAMVKGKAEPIRVYVVRRAKARAFRMPTRGVEGVETRMIGRADELGVLRAEFERVVEQPATRRVTVIGDAGIGKSRLLYEFENWIELHTASAYFFKGRALSTRRSAAFGLARDLLADRFGVLDSDAASVVAAKMRRGLGPTLTAGEADLVGHWLGFDLRSSEAVQRLLGSGQLAAAARAHLFRYFESLSTDGPVVIFLEDLHWADDESLALVDELVAERAAIHLLVVGVARPALLERPEVEGLLARSSAVLHLTPLGKGTTRTLVEEVLQKAESVPDELIDLVVERADGNAFYVEELVKMLIDDDVIETGELWDPWRVHVERLDPERVPATLTGVLQTRLDSLTPAERDALQRSSVVGRVFWDGTVASLGHDGIETTTRSLETARRRELIFRRERSSFDDNVEYTFKHALLRDVTYETVLLRDRQRLHGLVARWITEHGGERVSEYTALIATHHRLAGELAAAADMLRRAAVASLDAGNPAGARRNLHEAFELWRATGQEPTVDALALMTEACVRLGDIDAAYRHDGETMRLATTPEERATALFLGSWIASERGERDRERAMLDDALPDAERIGGLLLARVLSGLSWTEVVRGDAGAARAYAERAHELAVQLRHPTASREVLALLGAIASLSGDLQESLRYSVEALAVAVDAGDLEGQALAHSNIGVARHLLGDAGGSRDEYHAALHHYREASVLDDRLGRRMQGGMIAANTAQVHVRLGEGSVARRLIHHALSVVRQSGAAATLLFCVLSEADRRLVGGDRSRALELIGLVQRHPAFTKDNEIEIERILGRAGLPDDVIEQGLARGVGQDFDAVVEQLVRELA